MHRAPGIVLDCFIMSKTIGVFFDDRNFDEYPFDVAEYRTFYHDLAKSIHGRGGRLFIVRDASTYEGDNVFRGGWEFDGEEFIRSEKELRFELLYNKGHVRPERGDHVINRFDFDDLCTDKWRTYEFFSDLHPKSVHVGSADDVADALNELSTDMIVAKPVAGERGRGVLVLPKAKLPGCITEYPSILQEFIDTSGGIPGLAPGSHDFRILSAAGDIIASYIRTPPEQSLIANVAQGGTEITVPIDAIPAGALEVFEIVDTRLEGFTERLYSLDLGLDTDGTWRIIELNAKPGPPSPAAGIHYGHFLTKLVDFLLST